MSGLELVYPALTLAYMALEYWLGKTEKVKAGSVLEFVLIAMKAVAKANKPAAGE